MIHKSPKRPPVSSRGRLLLGAAAALFALPLSCAPVSRAHAAGVDGGKLPTRWDKDVDPAHPRPEYPRPQMARVRWMSLNGSWGYALTDKSASTPPPAFGDHILVPFCYESSLSGKRKDSIPDQRLWYRRTFTVPAAWKGEHVLLHFGAVNWRSTVSVNGKALGEHTGGYDSFSYDVTSAMKPGENTLVVSAWNPVAQGQVIGKQYLHPVSVLYTAVTGIWQTVWLEPVPAAHIDHIRLVPDIDAKALHVNVKTLGAGPGARVTIVATDGGRAVAKVTGAADTDLVLPVAKPRLWSPADPHLYDIQVTLAQRGAPRDSVASYFAMRKISLGKDAQGRTVMELNNKPYFQVGALDQGYWPDGVYTAPTDDALKFDIQTAKNFGFNLIRKHAKVEPDRWFYWTDKLGMLVWQDMPQAFDELTDEQKKQWLVEWRGILADHVNSPSVVVWTIFNENWGQHDTEAIAKLTKQIDPSRLVNAASGGIYYTRNGKRADFREPLGPGIGDILDEHDYPNPRAVPSDATRATVCGEFGGIASRITDHMWNDALFGYGATLHNPWQVTKRYQEVVKKAWGLKDDLGMSAYVYTQIVDVEIESNGLLTYDRQVVKVLPEIVKAANRGEFPDMPPAPASSDIVPTSADASQTWSYTTAQPAADWAKPGFAAGGWKTGPAPFGAGYPDVRTPWTDTPGDIWIRRMVTLPAAIPADLNVLLRHDEDAEVYINGVLAASEMGYTSDYKALPMSSAARAEMHSGENVIAVHCHQVNGGQFLDMGVEAR